MSYENGLLTRKSSCSFLSKTNLIYGYIVISPKLNLISIMLIIVQFSKNYLAQMCAGELPNLRLKECLGYHTNSSKIPVALLPNMTFIGKDVMKLILKRNRTSRKKPCKLYINFDISSLMQLEYQISNYKCKIQVKYFE